MAIITNTAIPAGLKGIREDLTDIIKMISPTDTPFSQNLGGFSASTNHYKEWQTDALAAAVSTNKRVVGDDWGSTFTAVTATTRIGNYIQKATKDVIIADDNKWVNAAGRRDEMAYQMSKKSKELKRDKETQMVANLGAVAPASATAGVSGSILAYITTNVDKDATGTNPVWTTKPDTPRTDGSATRAFTEGQLKNVIQLCWTQGGEPDTIMLGATQKVAFSGFDGIAQIRKDVAGKAQATIIGAADVYVSDFGDMKVVPNRFMRAIDALVLDFDLLKESNMGPKYRQVELAKTGLAEKRLIETNYTLVCLQEAGLGLVTDLT